MLSGCFCPTGTAAKETDSFKKMYNSSQFRFIQKIHQEKNIDDARVTQDKVIVKHGLKKMAAF
jgi:hypothetical protein